MRKLIKFAPGLAMIGRKSGSGRSEMAKKTVADKARKPYPPRKKTAERASAREDGRLATVLYLKPEVLAEVQAAAKADYQPTWLWVEKLLERALKTRTRR